MKRPNSWEDFEKLAVDETQFDVLRVRLYELAFTQTSAVAVNSISLLMELGVKSGSNDLTHVSTEALEAARERASKYLSELPSGAGGGIEESRNNDYTNQS
jgi:hypothetical protein